MENTFNREKVTAMLQSRGLTLQEFSDKSGISVSSLSAWLRGYRHPKLLNIRKIAECLQCKISDISTYNNPYLEKVPARRSHVIPPNAIHNSAELRECIKDAMMEQGIMGAAELSGLIAYDSPELVEHLLAGKLDWSPDILSAVSTALKIKQIDLPITRKERHMLEQNKILNQPKFITRAIPVIEWCDAANYIGDLLRGINMIDQTLYLDSAETFPAPLGCGNDTIALRVHDQPMYPTIHDNEILLCDPVESLNDLPDNKIVVVLFTESAKDCAGWVFCMRFRRLGGVISLTSDDFPGLTFENVNPADIDWIGQVIGKYDNNL